jgi:RNA polymerase sigma factor (sigma-70 family)
MNFTDEEYELVRKIARWTSSKWSAVEYDDLLGELYLWLCQNFRWVERYRLEDYGNQKLTIALNREAQRYCVRSQEASNGAPLDFGNLYSAREVARILPSIFQTVPSQSVAVNPQSGAPMSKPDHEAYMEAVAEVFDVREAFKQLPQEIRAALTMRFYDELSYRAIGEVLGISDTGANKKVQRGIAMICEKLAG